jgi:signal transduction histidine kinase
VQLAVTETAVSLTIGDDGLGMNQKQAVAANHFGLIGMRERAQLVGGRLQIDSRPGAGTRVRFTIERDAHD